MGVRLIVRGHVQGVYYRAFTEQEARRLGLRGWVRNLPDGAVEIVVAGAPDDPAVVALQAWCWKGSPASRVTAVEQGASDDPPDGAGAARFEVRR